MSDDNDAADGQENWETPPTKKPKVGSKDWRPAGMDARNERGEPFPVPKISRTGQRIYEPDGPNLTAFMLDRSPVSIIRGPFGSGTSTVCCHRIWAHAVEQNKSLIDGKRKSRWYIVRDTYPRIETTTLETWLSWFPEKLYGKLFTGGKPWKHEIRVGDIELDVLFFALEGDKAIGDLLSTEPTGFWFNELETIPLKVFSAAVGRVGRFPKLIEGGSKWSGVIADLNAPPENHWLPIMMGEAPMPEDLLPGEELQYRRPKGWAYFVQPPAMLEVKDVNGRLTGYKINPQAENLKFLQEGYYDRTVQGRSKRDIDAYVLNKIVPLVSGEAVWRQFNADIHVASEPLEPVEGHPVYVGLDFGRSPAAVFGQLIANRWYVQFEINQRT